MLSAEPYDLDVPEPPQIVFEAPAQCSDAARAQEALHAALSPSLAPGTAWTVVLRVSRDNGALRASGEITDPSGAAVARRALSHEGTQCAGLARAIGVWASLVLDSQLDRTRAAAAAPAPAPAPAPPPAPSTVDAHAHAPASEEGPEKPSPEAQLFLAHDDGQRQVEIGAASYLMAGSGAGVVAGGSAFVVWEVANGWFLRPAAAVGRTVAAVNPHTDASATLTVGRFDLCKRIPGNYLERRGLQVDLCGGAEGGVQLVDGRGGSPSEVGALGAVGPSLDFRGELGTDLSVLVRGLAEINFLHDASPSDVPASWVLARAEVGLSWRLR